MDFCDPFARVHPELKAPLQERGFAGLTPVQTAVLAPEARATNLRVSSQTGSGKTVAIGMALAESLIESARARTSRSRGPLALIITPTRELAIQVESELRWLFASVREIRVTSVTGGTDIMRERKVLSGKPALLVGTPGRLLDHIRRGSLDVSDLEHVVLDEADQMLDMGFKDELDAIVETLPETRRSHLISATFPSKVRSLAHRFQGDAFHVEGTKLGVANEDIHHIAHLVDPRDRYAALVNTLLLLHGERCLVFVRRRIDAIEVAEMLAGDGFSALPFSGELSQSQRNRTLKSFKTGVVSTIVATDVAARGIDVAEISAVVHLDLPDDADAYTHRSGRTGRAGMQGRSIVIVPHRAHYRAKRLFESARVEAEWTPIASPKKIEKSVVKRTRRALRSLIENAPAPDDNRREYAEQLLQSHDAATVIAHLLEMAEPKLPCAPVPMKNHESPRVRPNRAPRAQGSRAHPQKGHRDRGRPFRTSANARH